MALVVTARLLTGVFDATTGDPARQTAEWPPHPLRLFSAMVDAASQCQVDGDDALRWLENLPPPEVWASERRESSVRAAFVPVNGLPKKPKHTLYPGRIAAATPKAWPRVVPAVPIVRFVWRDVEPDPVVLAALRAVGACVPYLGRASSPVDLSVEGGDVPEPLEGAEAWVPAGDGDVALRVPFVGALGALRDAYTAGDLVHEVAFDAPYRSPRRLVAETAVEPARRGAVEGPYGDMVTFRMRPSPGLDATMALAVTSQLRRAVISRIGTDVPAAVHGHEEGTPHVAWLALPVAGDEHSSGRIIGLGIAIPRAMQDADRARLLRALVGSAGEGGLTRLALPTPLTREGGVAVERWSSGLPWTVDPRRWTRPSRRWATVTPVVWERFTRDEDDLDTELRDSFVRAGYPAPVAGGLSWSRSPFLRGAAQPRPQQVRRAGDPPRQYRHVLVEFPERVRGPVLVGQLRYFGVGLFAPLDES